MSGRVGEVECAGLGMTVAPGYRGRVQESSPWLPGGNPVSYVPGSR